MSEEISTIKLTAFAHGAGCGCKIAPAVLQDILALNNTVFPPEILVGNNTGDDAAVYDLGNGQALISTTDFFMPIVDDAFAFGQIAAANSISDVYAMGGKPIMAIAILGWPIDKLPAALANSVMEGARYTCTAAGITIAGGHTIDSPEPFFGLAVNGLITVKHIKKNSTAQAGDLLLLTKPIGVGILATALKRGLIEPAEQTVLMEQLISLNKIGEELGAIEGVHALTDITGFGLAGHLLEILNASKLSASLNYSAIPILEAAKKYALQRVIPDATYRNWNSYNTSIAFDKGVNVMEAFNILPDPQTNGGLLIALAPESLKEVQAVFYKHQLNEFINPIGFLQTAAAGEKRILVTA